MIIDDDHKIRSSPSAVIMSGRGDLTGGHLEWGMGDVISSDHNADQVIALLGGFINGVVSAITVVLDEWANRCSSGSDDFYAIL